MSQSRWSYFVPLQNNITRALQELREEVFKNKDYEFPNPKALRPKSIDALVKMMGSAGTHSILDIEGVSLEPKHRCIHPLPKEAMLQICGSVTPCARELVDMACFDGFDDYVCDWQGIYTTSFFVDGTPSELFIFGYSGL